MTDYHFPPYQDSISPTAWQERKAKRKQQLTAVRARRKLIYERLRKSQCLAHTQSHAPQHQGAPNAPITTSAERIL